MLVPWPSHPSSYLSNVLNPQSVWGSCMLAIVTKCTLPACCTPPTCPRPTQQWGPLQVTEPRRWLSAHTPSNRVASLKLEVAHMLCWNKAAYTLLWLVFPTVFAAPYKACSENASASLALAPPDHLPSRKMPTQAKWIGISRYSSLANSLPSVR